MGTRASFALLPKADAKKIYNSKDEEFISKVLENCETMLYDFCTDAVIDCYKKIPRLTRSKLSSECDIFYGRMRRSTWEMFTMVVHERAKNQATTGMPLAYWTANAREWIEPDKNKYRLTSGITWVDAYYQCKYIEKIIDWSQYYILCEVG